MLGPYLPLRKGSYTAIFEIELLQATTLPNSICFDVIAKDGSLILAQTAFPVSSLRLGCKQQIPVRITVDDTVFGVQFRVICPKDVFIQTNRDIQLQSEAGW